LYADDVSIEGLTKALEGALALHANYPANKEELALKKGPPPEFAVPEKMPKMEGKYGATINYEANVVQSCIHCHQIGDALKQYHREKSTKLPEHVLFPYPHPKALGLILSPRERASVIRVDSGSLAEKAGFKAGDEIQKIGGQTPLSIADVQWVLHHTPADGGTVAAKVLRDGKTVDVSLKLPEGWKQLDDIAWRASSWELRRIAFGGMFMKKMPDEEQKEKNLPADKLALKVMHVGQFSPHDRAKKAGFVKDDIVISFNDRRDLLRETDLFEYSLNDIEPGTVVPVKILRGGKEMTLQLSVGK
jgi:S1-C subfamily serine protease